MIYVFCVIDNILIEHPLKEDQYWSTSGSRNLLFMKEAVWLVHLKYVNQSEYTTKWLNAASVGSVVV